MSDNPDRKYWAAEADPEKICLNLNERYEQYWRAIRANLMWRRMLRNLRYVHNLAFPQASDTLNFETKFMDNGRVGVSPGLFRRYLADIHNLATGDRMAFKTKAINTDNESLQEAFLGNGLLDVYFQQRRAAGYLKMGAWHSLLLNSGYVYAPWKTTLGQKIDNEIKDIEGKTVSPAVFQGDFEFWNPTILDVARDVAITDWRKNQWLIVRTPQNRYDLAAEFPEFEEKILAYVKEKWMDFWFYQGIQPLIFQEDMVWRFDFYHLPSPAMPTGRHVVYIPGTTLLDEAMPYKGMPLFRCAHGEFFLNAMGWTVANDLQSLQEMMTGVFSSISTNIAAHSVGHIWMVPDSRLRTQVFEGGLKALVCETEPKPVNFTAISPDAWRAVEVFMAAMEKISGINAARLGQPEANVRSAKAMQVIAAQAVESVNAFAQSYRDMAEDLATHMLRTINTFMRGEQKALIVGKGNAEYLKTYKAGSFSNIDRVVIEAVDPLSNTYAGRVAEASDLVANRVIQNVQEYIQVKQTGTVEPVYEADRAIQNLIREENEALRQGQPVHANELQPHKLHVMEHSTILSTLQNSNDPTIREVVLAHIGEHVMLWNGIRQPGMPPDPNLLMLQAALGYPLPPPMMAPAQPQPAGGQAPAKPNPQPEGVQNAAA